MYNFGLIFLVFIGYLFFFPITLKSQTFVAGDQITLQINDYSLIATSGGPINLVLTSSIAGNPAPPVSNNNMYVKVSSLTPGQTTRSVSAKITSGTIPSGTILTLVAANCTSGGGVRGTAINNPITLSTSDQMIIGGIGSSFTGTGTTDGYRLTYTWAPNNPATNYASIQSNPSPTIITVVLTLSAHSGNN